MASHLETPPEVGETLGSSEAFVTQYIYRYAVDEANTLIVNTLTGAADLVSPAIAALLEPRARLRPAAIPAQEREQLIARGYLLSGERQQQAEVESWFADFRQRMRSFHFIVCPTLLCNLRCHYCYEPIENRRAGSSMSADHVESMLAAMDSLAAERRADQVQLEFFGGEPFLRSNLALVEGVMAAAAKRGWSISGITNGTQLDAYLPAFRRWRDRISQLQVTMDGPRAMHDSIRVNAAGRGSFDAICANVDAVLAVGVPIVLRVNTGRDTVAGLPELFALFEARGWTASEHFLCQLAPINDHGCTGCVANYQPEFHLIEQLHERFADWEATRDRYRLVLGYDMERRTSLLRQALFGKASPGVRARDLSGCSASNHHYVVFGADGLLYACPETVGVREAAIGRFHPQFALDRAGWAKWDINISNTAKCRDCNIAPVCGGACPWHGMNASGGDPYAPHCNYAQQTMRTYLDVNRPQLEALLE